MCLEDELFEAMNEINKDYCEAINIRDLILQSHMHQVMKENKLRFVEQCCHQLKSAYGAVARVAMLTQYMSEHEILLRNVTHHENLLLKI